MRFKQMEWVGALAFALSVVACGSDGESGATSSGATSTTSSSGGGSTSVTTTTTGTGGGGGGDNVCGDGVVGGTEACDDQGESATCNADCTTSSCGDTVVNAAAGEDCDEGAETATCNADCSSAACGDGVVNAAAGEDCDDAGESAACNADCSSAACGDGTLNVSAGEACDDMGESATCDADCSAASCGDGTTNVAASEACDDAGESATCDADCSAASCGDGTVNVAASEACDDMGESAACDADCTAASCGDGTTNVAAGEACDAMGESAACDADCSAASCGDGTTNTSAGEACDTMGESAACDANCTPANCGDGTTNATAGETCDTSGESAACDADCTAVSCGDGTTNVSAGEACDTMGESAACDANCTAATCGDGTVNVSANEQCDTLAQTATCETSCTLPDCGDGIANALASEDCDDGNAANGDGCSIECFGECAPAVLTTTFPGNNSAANGMMFDVTALQAVSITGFDGNYTNVAGTILTFSIYTKSGTYVGSENNAAAWTLLGTSTGPAAGVDNPTNVPIPIAVNVAANATQAFFVTTAAHTPRYITGTLVGAVAAQDAFLQVKEGRSLNANFTSGNSPRIFSGKVRYAPTLATPVAGGAAWDGNMFDVSAATDVTIHGVNVNLATGTYTMEVYYVPGGHVGHETDAAAWTFAGTGSVTSTGTGTLRHIALDPAITIPGGSTYGLYVTINAANQHFVTYSSGTALGAVIVSDANLTIYEGNGITYPFDNSSLLSPRKWNGSLDYSVCP